MLSENHTDIWIGDLPTSESVATKKGCRACPTDSRSSDSTNPSQFIKQAVRINFTHSSCPPCFNKELIQKLRRGQSVFCATSHGLISNDHSFCSLHAPNTRSFTIIRFSLILICLWAKSPVSQNHTYFSQDPNSSKVFSLMKWQLSYFSNMRRFFACFMPCYYICRLTDYLNRLGRSSIKFHNDGFHKAITLVIM